MAVVFTSVAAGYGGRVYEDDGSAVIHCAAETGFERWATCIACGGRIVWCFECGSVDREHSTCTCSYHVRTH